MNHMEDRRPIYQRLRDQIAAEIAQNIWKPGEAIASEAEAVSFSFGPIPGRQQ